MTNLKSVLQLVLMCITLAGCGESVELPDQAASKDIAHELEAQAQSSDGSSDLLFSWNFEDSTPFHDLNQESKNTNEVSVATDPLDPSNKVMKTVLPVDTGRTEVSLKTTTLLYAYADKAFGSPDASSLGKELWIGVRILTAQQPQTTKPSLFQLGPVNNPLSFPGVGSKGFLQLRINNQEKENLSDDRWNLTIFEHPDYTPIPQRYFNNFAVPVYGTWENFVIHCIYSSGSDGLIEVWKNGELLESIPGANAVSGNRIRIKWGPYIGASNKPTENLIYYYDDIKIGGANSSYLEVAPQRKLLSPAADGYVQGSTPDTNFGDNAKLIMKTSPDVNYSRITYLKFDLRNLSFSPGSAKLILTTDLNNLGGVITANTCFPATVNWAEELFTWSNKPDTGSSIASVATVQSVEKDLVLDVSQFVKDQYNQNNKMITIALTGDGVGAVIKSKEDVNGKGPKLSILK